MSDTTNAADKLAELLEEKTRELEELRQSIEDDKDEERWRWCRHTDIHEPQTLPVPRLEIWFDLENGDDYNRVLVYRMIYRHFLGHCVAVPLGCTTQSGGNPAMDRELVDYVPFRDGAHINNDSKQFGWPMFIVHGNEWAAIPPRQNK